MANTITVGTVTITLPDNIKIPAEAGKLNVDQVRAIEKTRPGLGVACSAAADGIAKEGAAFVVPGVTAAGIKDIGDQSDQVDLVLADLRTLVSLMQQANLLIDRDAQVQLRKVNEQVKAQGKFDAGLFERFSAVRDYFGAGG